MDILNDKTLAGKLLLKMMINLSKAISSVEGSIFGNKGPLHPPIFILGLPRGGTTLVYQTLCHCFELAYTPMLTNYLPFAPALTTWFCRKRQARYSSDFESHYGMTKGTASPGEGVMWNIWFLKDKHYQKGSDLEEGKARQIVSLVGRVERISGRPFVNKNLKHYNYLGVLAELFPAAVFLVVLRQPRDVAFSILRARIEKQGDPKTWYSTKPSSYAHLLQLPPEKSVVGQIKGLMEDLQKDIQRIGPDRFAVLCYEDFCNSPPGKIKGLRDFMGSHGIPLQRRQRPPERFELSVGRTDKLSSEQIALVDQALSEAFSMDPYADFPGRWVSCVDHVENPQDDFTDVPHVP
jgi:hypothetical protein